MHIFYNPEEDRLRAGWRILSQFIIFIFITFVLVLIFGAQDGGYFFMGAAILISIWISVRWIDRRPVTELGIGLKSPHVRELMEGSLIGFLAVTGVTILLLLTGSWQPDGFGWNLAGTRPFLQGFLFYLVLMIFVGIYEEIWVRGYLLKNLQEGLEFDNFDSRKALFAAVVITSVFFGLLHATNPNVTLPAIIVIVLAGFMLAIPVLFTGRLSVSIGIHFSWNFTLGGIYGFPVSGMDHRDSLIQSYAEGAEWWTGGAFGPEAGVSGMIVVILLSLYLWFRMQKVRQIEFQSEKKREGSE